MKDDLMKIKSYLEVAKDVEVRIALLRLIEILEAYRILNNKANEENE